MANPVIDTSSFTPDQVTAFNKASALAPTPFANALTPSQLAAQNAQNSITASSLASSPTPSYQQPTPSTPPPTVDTASYTTATTLGDNEQKASDSIKVIQGLNDTLAGKSAYQTEQNTAAGVDPIQQAINDNTTAVKMLQNETNSAKLDSEGRQAPSFLISGEQGAIDRSSAIKALKLASISDALSNNLVAAQHKADAAVAAKYGPIEAQQKASLANLDLILKDPKTTLEEKKRANAQTAIVTAQATATAQAKQDAADVFKVTQDAAQNSASFVKTTQYPTLSTALNAIGNAKTPQEAAQIQAATGLVASQNKSQIIGSADTGYRNVVTDASGKVISSTPVTGGTGTGTKSTKPLTASEVQQYQIDYPDAGIKIGDSPASIQSKINPVVNYSGTTFNGLTATLPTGGTLTFPSQAAADQFKKDNAISGGTTATVPPTATSPLETQIAQLKKSGILTDGDIRAALLKQGHTQAEVNASSVGSFVDKGLSALSSLFKVK